MCEKVSRGEFEVPASASQAIPESATNEKSLLWARKYRDWTVEDWSKVIWSDESNIEPATAVHRASLALLITRFLSDLSLSYSAAPHTDSQRSTISQSLLCISRTPATTYGMFNIF
ncbi:hypothetical protein Trydic_g15148 [Trypoxylus dichotomus]